jgi:hypothetical protein
MVLWEMAIVEVTLVRTRRTRVLPKPNTTLNGGPFLRRVRRPSLRLTIGLCFQFHLYLHVTRVFHHGGIFNDTTSKC